MVAKQLRVRVVHRTHQVVKVGVWYGAECAGFLAFTLEGWSKFKRLFFTDRAVEVAQDMQAYLEAYIITHQDEDGTCRLCGSDEDEPCDVTCPVGDARNLVAQARYALPKRDGVEIDE